MHQISENEYLEIGSGEPIGNENLVEFYLLYEGPLHSAGQANPRVEKHAIRRVLHSQLRRLWETQPSLRELAGRSVINTSELNERFSDPAKRLEAFFETGLRDRGRRWERNGFNFLPLVTEQVAVRCALDILFLRTDDRPFVLQGGDIDGRLKILFDALRMTDNSSELPTGAKPEEGEDPLCVLLQNDNLISEVHVNTDRLLKLPVDKPLDQHDVYLEIGVRLNRAIPTARDMTYSWVFE